MPLSKTSKKTRKIAEETAKAPEVIAPAEVTSKPRTTRSSKSKSIEASETGSVKHRKAATKPVVAEKAAVAAVAVQRAVTREEIAELAHSYWVARGCAHGSSDQDWLRAERELKSRL